MKITIEVISTISCEIELSPQSNTNENGIETIYSGEGEIEIEGSELATINARLQRNHILIDPDDIEISENIKTSKEKIAEQMNNYLRKNI
jgi:hypothetical protein